MAVDLLATFGIPLSVGGALALLIQSLITAAVIVLSDKIIAHEMDIKHAFMMSIGAYFAVPLIMLGVAAGGIQLPSVVTLYIVPLLAWIVLGEILLKADTVTKAKVAAVAFIVYTVLQFVGVVGIIVRMLPF